MADRVEVGYAIQRAEVGDHSIEMAGDMIELFDAKHGRVNAACSCNSHHLTRSIDSANVHAPLREMERIFAGATADIKQLVSAPEERIHTPPHAVPLQPPTASPAPHF